MLIDFEFNGSTARQEGVFVKKFISIPTGAERYTEYVIPGRDGSLTYKEGTYDNITITVQMMYLERQENIREKYRQTKKWLLHGSGKLKFSDQPDFHYIVNRVEIKSNETETLMVGTFTVNFICLPHEYLDSGDVMIDFCETLYNEYDVSHPVFYVQGEGMCTITVNGNSMTANVGQDLVIDTERMIAYRQSGQLQNTSVNGDYEDLYFQNGVNTMSATAGFEIQILPKWRRL